MGWLAGLKTLFKGSLDINKTFDVISSKMDDWKFTEEERARYNREAADSLASFVKETLSESTERARTRRDVARVVIYLYLVVFLFALVFIFIKPDYTTAIMQLVDEMYITTGFLSIVGFFFGGYYIDKFQKGSK